MLKPFELDPQIIHLLILYSGILPVLSLSSGCRSEEREERGFHTKTAPAFSPIEGSKPGRRFIPPLKREVLANWRIDKIMRIQKVVR